MDLRDGLWSVLAVNLNYVEEPFMQKRKLLHRTGTYSDNRSVRESEWERVSGIGSTS